MGSTLQPVGTHTITSPSGQFPSTFVRLPIPKAVVGLTGTFLMIALRIILATLNHSSSQWFEALSGYLVGSLLGQRFHRSFLPRHYLAIMDHIEFPRTENL